MSVLNLRSNQVGKVQDAILDQITSGRLPSGARLNPQRLARELEVPEHAVQHALLLLADKGVLQNGTGRGPTVAALDVDFVANMYEVRSVLEGLAARRAAQRVNDQAVREGLLLIRLGRQAVRQGAVELLVRADHEFHQFIYQLADNPLIETSIRQHWIATRRVMSEVLQGDEARREVWHQHEAILQAIVAGDPERAEQKAREHIERTAQYMVNMMRLDARRRSMEDAHAV